MKSTADRWQVASRANVPPFHVMDLLAAAHTRRRTHGDLLDLLAGQPSTGAPAPVKAEAIRLLEGSDPLGYTPAVGIAYAGLFLLGLIFGLNFLGGLMPLNGPDHVLHLLTALVALDAYFASRRDATVSTT